MPANYTTEDIRELATRVEYERVALTAYAAKALRRGSGSKSDTIYWDGSTPIASAPARVEIGTTISFSGPAVRTALLELTPMAFAAAFKVQDMLFEWVLRKHGSTAWRFSEKIEQYRALQRSDELSLPEPLPRFQAICTAFFELYAKLAARRNVLTHGHSFTVTAAGDIVILDHADRPTSVTVAKLGAYVDLCVRIIDAVVAGEVDEPSRHVIEGDIFDLRDLHQVGVPERRVRHEDVRIVCVGAAVLSKYPAEVRIDLRDLRRRMRTSYPVGDGGTLTYSATVLADVGDSYAQWEVESPDLRGGGTLVLTGEGHHPARLIPKAGA